MDTFLEDTKKEIEEIPDISDELRNQLLKEAEEIDEMEEEFDDDDEEELKSIEKKVSKPKAEQDWIYLIHHIHPPEKADEMETLHHCIMYEKKNEKGEEYSQQHIEDNKVFLHGLILKDINTSPKVVFDHLNNVFKIEVKEIGKDEYAIITGPVDISDITWSAQDKGYVFNDSISV